MAQIRHKVETPGEERKEEVKEMKEWKSYCKEIDCLKDVMVDRGGSCLRNEFVDDDIDLMLCVSKDCVSLYDVVTMMRLWDVFAGSFISLLMDMCDEGIYRFYVAAIGLEPYEKPDARDIRGALIKLAFILAKRGLFRPGDSDNVWSDFCCKYGNLTNGQLDNDIRWYLFDWRAMFNKFYERVSLEELKAFNKKVALCSPSTTQEEYKKKFFDFIASFSD